jgi:8-oxo-dGTP diphosphatase
VDREYPDRPILAVSAVVVKDGKVLLARRGTEPNRSLWTLPGGAVHPGETLCAAVARELHEECGIDAAVEDVPEVLERIIPDGTGRTRYHFVILAYRATWRAGGLTLSDELEDARWVDPTDLDRYQAARGTIDAIRRLLDRPHQRG